MKQLKRHFLTLLLLGTLCMTTACGGNQDAANDSQTKEDLPSDTGENGAESLDGRPFDEILFDTDGDGVYDHTDVDGDGLLEEIGRDTNDLVDDVINGVTETGETLMDGLDNGTDGTETEEPAPAAQ